MFEEPFAEGRKRRIQRGVSTSMQLFLLSHQRMCCVICSYYFTFSSCSNLHIQTEARGYILLSSTRQRVQCVSNKGFLGFMHLGSFQTRRSLHHSRRRVNGRINKAPYVALGLTQNRMNETWSWGYKIFLYLYMVIGFPLRLQNTIPG